MSTLTDRYVWAVVRSLPEKQRADIDRELRASIADSIDDRIEAGADEATAEREVLLELGDPDRLAAGYADRPSFLIGPKYYFDYVRLLKVLYVIVLPIASAAILILRVLAGDGIGEVIGATIPAALGIAVHLGFWTTLVFAILERTNTVKAEPLTPFVPDTLPQLPDKKSGAGIGDAIASVVFLLLFAGAILWQAMSSAFVDASGAPIPLLQEDLWQFWIPYTYLLIALELAFALVLYGLRRWSWPLVIVNISLNIAFVVPAIWLVLEDRVFNPEFMARLENIGVNVITPIMVLAFVAIAIGDIVDGIVKTRRATRTVG